ncbi:MAG: hypothetical protein HOF75_03955 [Flavobacteriaceae bacterium]|nr:hypothetical protein [Flavobacteriaceae bacterium]MBT3920264.1 hypothetical protein [Flavobacteriaceae bacterium]MBT6705002.1 hypothetical protein [Flavobacteriaceae bacterium]MBT7242183.1 hypothetical protein [Flavobacteriaceae bacterium]
MTIEFNPSLSNQFGDAVELEIKKYNINSMADQETYISSAVRRYKNELITWGCIALFGMLAIIFYHIMIV